MVPSGEEQAMRDEGWDRSHYFTYLGTVLLCNDTDKLHL